MIDIHSHILPGIDDGPSDMSESFEMAEIAVAEGFRSIVATPHYGRASFCSDIGRVRLLTDQLNKELRQQGIEVFVYPGMEILVCPEVLNLLINQKVIGLNHSRYVLLELPAMSVPAGLNNLIQSLLNSDWKIIIAHPEKNMDIQRRPEWIRQILVTFQPGEVLVQITADSLTGTAGSLARDASRFLVENRLAHILATDAHSATTRPPLIREALEISISLVGKEIAHKMAYEWPAMILRDADLIPDSPVPMAKRRKWWRILLRK